MLQKSEAADAIGLSTGMQRHWRARGGFTQPQVIKVAKALLKELKARRLSAPRVIERPNTLRDLYDRRVRFKEDTLTYPEHLQPYIDELQHGVNEPITTAFSAPPQHHKTTTTLMMLAFLLLTQPDKQHFYITYSGTRARDVSKDFSYLLQQLDVPHEYANCVITFEGSTVRFVGMEQGITGYSVNGLCVVDDPFKNQDEAKSPTIRENVWRNYVQNVQTRQTGRMSVVAMCTRWEGDDLIGRMAKKGVKYINLKAICDDDETTPVEDRDPLGRRPNQPLLASIPNPGADQRANDERAWFAMYQGEPSPEGMRLFQTETTYSRLPVSPMTVLYGLDSAYAGKKKSDWSVLVRCLLDTATGLIYIDRVLREQTPIAVFGKHAAEVQGRRMGPVTWFVGGQEQYASADMLRREGLKRLECITARGQLRVRASRVAVAWNSGKVLVPAIQDAAMQQFVDEVTSFTGDNRAHDDCVAALHGALHVAVTRGLTASPANQPIDEDPIITIRKQQGRTVDDYERELSRKIGNHVRVVGYSPRIG